MSEILWCDTGAHAFSATDPDRKVFSETAVKQGERPERVDICGPCSKTSNAFRPLVQGQVEAKTPGSPAYIKSLEEENGIGV